MQIDKELYIEINEYCKLNGLKTRDFIHKILNEAFLKEKYGDTPFFTFKKEAKVENNNNNQNIQITNENKMLEERQREIGTELSNLQIIKTNEESEHLIIINETDEVKPQPKKKRKLS